MTLQLKTALEACGASIADAARAAQISRPALSGLINHHTLPSRYDRAAVESRIATFVRQQGGDTGGLFEVAPPRSSAAAPSPSADATTSEEMEMLLRHCTLTPQARRHFGLTADPFAEPTSAEEVYLTGDMRYVRESMYQTARHGGFMAVVGESGSGKSTLREELVDRLHRESEAVIVVEPYVLASEANDKLGKTLRSTHIAESVMAAVAPHAPVRSSPDARFRQVHNTLRESARAGHQHVLVIEEAHALPSPTLSHLKRWRELKDGLRPLLSIILVSQPEILTRLSPANPETREVTQRIEIVTLPPLDNELEGYLQHRVGRAGSKLEQVIDTTGLQALRNKLTPTRNARAVSLLYPLAVHNALAAAMNRAADLGVPTVNADVIAEV